MRSVLITGGSGGFGTAFVKKILRDDINWRQHLSATEPRRIVVYSRGEQRQAEMQREIKDPNEQLRYFVGDVRDRDRLRRAMEGVDTVVHAAALKRIETGFYNPLEVKKTNIDGAANVIEAAHDAGVKRVLALSTDKAHAPVSPYGTSKAFAESLFIAANNARGASGPRFAVVRYGNVWCSPGSVVPTWRKMLETSDTVPVTDPDCTRFFMTMGQAVDLVLETLRTMVGGEIVIPSLPAYRLGDLAIAMGAKIEVRGLPAFEKLHESMGPNNSSNRARRMTLTELEEALRDLNPTR